MHMPLCQHCGQLRCYSHVLYQRNENSILLTKMGVSSVSTFFLFTTTIKIKWLSYSRCISVADYNIRMLLKHSSHVCRIMKNQSSYAGAVLSKRSRTPLLLHYVCHLLGHRAVSLLLCSSGVTRGDKLSYLSSPSTALPVIIATPAASISTVSGMLRSLSSKGRWDSIPISPLILSYELIWSDYYFLPLTSLPQKNFSMLAHRERKVFLWSSPKGWI